jgi:transposase
MKSESIKGLTAKQVEEFGFAPDVALAVEANRAVSETLGHQIEALEQRLEERVRLRTEFKLLQTVPGIGETLARPQPGSAASATYGIQARSGLRGRNVSQDWDK